MGKRLSILSLPIVQEEYSVPKFNAHERDVYFTFSETELNAVKHFHSHRNRIHFLLMLGYFKIKPVCLIYNWKDIEDDFQFVSEKYFPMINKQMHNIDRFTRSRLYKKVLIISEYRRYLKMEENKLKKHLNNCIKIYADETQLFSDAITFLKSNMIAIPYYSTLQKVISKVILDEETRLTKIIGNHKIDSKNILRLIDSDENEFKLNELKKLIKHYKFGEIRKELFRRKHLSNLAEHIPCVLKKMSLSSGNIRYFASRCQRYNINELNELKNGKSILYLICFISVRLQIANDSISQAFLVSVKKIHDKAIDFRVDQLNQQGVSLLNDMNKIPKILKLFIDNTIKNSESFGIVRDSAFNFIPENEFHLVCEKLDNVKPDKMSFHWEYIDSHFHHVIKNIRPILKSLDIGCRNNSVLLSYFDNVKKSIESKETIPLVDGRLIKAIDKKYLKIEKTDCEMRTKTITNRHEMYFYQLLYDGIRNGNIYIKNSLEYRNLDDYLVNDKVWNDKNVNLNKAGLGWMIAPSNQHLTDLEMDIVQKIKEVGDRIDNGNNTFIKREVDTNKIIWTKAVTPKDEALTDQFFSHFSRKSLVNVLRTVNTETRFLDHLVPISNRYNKSSATDEQLFACIIANGTFQGIFKFSGISGQQYKLLKRVEGVCFHEVALQNTNNSITNAGMKLSIIDDFKLADGESHASTDGQRFKSKHGNPIVGHNAKYFGLKKGGIVYTLVSSHFATHGKVIPARSHESHHLFDIVYNNTSDLKANIISTDSHGVNRFNHAIMNTFGFQFTPRYARFKSRFLNEFTISFDNTDVLTLTKPINWKLIKSEWDNIVKIMLSLSMRTVQQSTLVQKLCSYEKHNVTMLALAEYNRIYKCLHMLDYADDKQLRQVIQESLNRGESLQGLKRALAESGGHHFRGKNPEEMSMWNGCANILANCIVYFNAMIMSSFKNYCIETKNEDQIQFLQSISPASWENIILNGFYDLSDNEDYWNIEEEIKSLKLAA